MEKTRTKRTSRASKSEAQQEFASMLPAVAAEASSDVDKPARMKRAEGRRTVERASSYTVDSIIKGMADLNIALGKSLSDLTGKLTTEAGKLAELQSAIEIQSAQLKEMHDIDAAAVSLKALLEAQSERRQSFEEEMTQKQSTFDTDMSRKREEWQREQAAHELAVKERDATLKKSREREEDEYQYALAIRRRKDGEVFAAREKELSEKLAAASAREVEFNELKKKAEQYPKELADAVKKAEDTVRAAMLKQAEADAKLMAKEVEGDKRVSAMKIASLEEAVAKQAVQIEQLTKQLTASNVQVQDIAVKAIEGASGIKALAAVNEIALEQAKTASTKKGN